METTLETNEIKETNKLIKLTERDLFLIEWSLDMMARSSPQSSTLRLEIDKLRQKLVMN
jgi:hypothetical protein